MDLSSLQYRIEASADEVMARSGNSGSLGGGGSLGGPDSLPFFPGQGAAPLATTSAVATAEQTQTLQHPPFESPFDGFSETGGGPAGDQSYQPSSFLGESGGEGPSVWPGMYDAGDRMPPAVAAAAAHPNAASAASSNTLGNWAQAQVVAALAAATAAGGDTGNSRTWGAPTGGGEQTPLQLDTLTAGGGTSGPWPSAASVDGAVAGPQSVEDAVARALVLQMQRFRQAADWILWQQQSASIMAARMGFQAPAQAPTAAAVAPVIPPWLTVVDPSLAPQGLSLHEGWRFRRMTRAQQLRAAQAQAQSHALVQTTAATADSHSSDSRPLRGTTPYSPASTEHGDPMGDNALYWAALPAVEGMGTSDCSLASTQRHALGFLQQMTGDISPAAPPSAAVEAAAGSDKSTQPRDEVIEDVCNEISAAVANFLANEDAIISEHSSEAPESPRIGSDEAPRPPSPPPPAQPPPQQQPPAHAEEGAGQKQFVSTRQLSPQHAQQQMGGHNTNDGPRTDGSAPTPEGVQDFLNVLRRRPLPPDWEQELRGVVQKCLISLYRDRIRPTQYQVQRRLLESGCSEPIVQALLPFCAREPEQYKILPPMHGKQPVILLVAEPPWFVGWVDVDAPEGDYSQDVWDALAALFRDGTTLPVQPYQAALELKGHDVPHLQSLSLGELEHVIRLALGRRQLLFQHSGRLRLDCVGKVQRESADTTFVAKAPRHNPASVDDVKLKLPPMPTATPPQVVSSRRGFAGDLQDICDWGFVLIQLAQSFPDGITLSSMRQQVQSHCQRQPRAVGFQCSKIAEAFHLAPTFTHVTPAPENITSMRDICLKPPKSSSLPPHVWQGFYHLKGRLLVAAASAGGATTGPAPIFGNVAG